MEGQNPESYWKTLSYTMDFAYKLLKIRDYRNIKIEPQFNPPLGGQGGKNK
jgi:hypothetical protein